MDLLSFHIALAEITMPKNNKPNKVLRVRVLDLDASHEAGHVIDFDIKNINFDENSGTLYIEF